MNADLELYQSPLPGWVDMLEPAWQLARRLERASEFVPAEFVGRAEAIMAAILTGAELGRGPMWSLRNLAVIKGRPTLYAAAQRALVLAAGHELWVEDHADDKVVMCGRRQGEERTTTVEWTMRRAQQARLTGNPSWKDYPRAMLTARATTELCGLLFADVVAGIAASEEAADGFPLEARQSVETPPTPIRRRRNPPDTQPLAGGTPGEGTGTEATASPSQTPPPLPGDPDYIDAGLQGAWLAAATETTATDEPDPDLGEVPDVADVARRKLFALTRDAFPRINKGHREVYRHALTALATRDRDDGPTIHFGDLTDGERAALTALLTDVRTGKLLVATEPEGAVVATSNRRQAVITPAHDNTPWTVTVTDR